MKRKKKDGKDPLEGLIEWASPTDKVYNIGLVVGGIPVSALRPGKKSAGKKRKESEGPKGKGK